MTTKNIFSMINIFHYLEKVTLPNLKLRIFDYCQSFFKYIINLNQKQYDSYFDPLKCGCICGYSG